MTEKKTFRSNFPSPDAAVLFFALYAVFGWCYEVFLEVFIYHWGFSDGMVVKILPGAMQGL